MAGINIKFGSDTKGFSKGLRRVTAGIKSITRTVALVAAPLAALATAVGGVGLAVKAVNTAAGFETLELQMASVLNSTTEAAKKMGELKKFAASTPKSLEDLVSTFIKLEALTGGKLSDAKGLRMVGDVSATTGENMQELAVTIGRLYSALNSQRAAGEPLARLSELGVLTPEVRSEIEDLTKAGADGAVVWAVAAKRLESFGGSMKAMSSTFAGRISTMKDGWSLLLAKFGEPIMNALKPLLDKLTIGMEDFGEKATKMGEKIGATIDTLTKSFDMGEGVMLLKLGLKSAFAEGIALLGHGLMASTVMFARMMLVELGIIGAIASDIFSNKIGDNLGAVAGRIVLASKQSANFAAGLVGEQAFSDESIAVDKMVIKDLTKSAYTPYGEITDESSKRHKKTRTLLRDELASDLMHAMKPMLTNLGKTQQTKDFLNELEIIKTMAGTGSNSDEKSEPKTFENIETNVKKQFEFLPQFLAGFQDVRKNLSGTIGVSSLSKIGGGRGREGVLVNLQKEANAYLREITANTKGKTVAVAG